MTEKMWHWPFMAGILKALGLLVLVADTEEETLNTPMSKPHQHTWTDDSDDVPAYFSVRRFVT